MRWQIIKLATRLIAKAIRILQAKFHCNKIPTVQDIQDYVSLIFGDTLYILLNRILSAIAESLVAACHFLPLQAAS